jgi:hypothetical protein
LAIGSFFICLVYPSGKLSHLLFCFCHFIFHCKGWNPGP